MSALARFASHGPRAKARRHLRDDTAAPPLKRQDLQGCIRDLVALSSLPSLWSGRELAAVLESFLDVLLGMLPLDLAYVRVAPSAATDEMELFRGAGVNGAGLSAAEVGRRLQRQLVLTPLGRPCQLPSAFGLVPLYAVRYPLGLDDMSGEVMLASHRAGFPGASEKLLGRVAANHLQLHLELGSRQRAQQEADRRKDDFLAVLGHELRNVLAAICPVVEVWQRGADGQAPKERAMIGRQVGHLTRLVDDLLDVSRITRGHMTLVRSRVDVWDIVARATEMARPLLEEKRHRLCLGASPEALIVDGDEVRLCQVVANLLTNAAKYTDPGGEIRVLAAREEEEVVLRVRDSGVGLSPELLPRVFEMFVRGAGSSEQAAGGLGVGLAIVKALVEMHGGRVEAHSEGTGSEFVVRLPAAPADSAEPRSDLHDDTQVACADGERHVRVLVVEDNRDVAEAVSVVLRAAGHEVQLAFDGVEALRAADQFAPEMILLDIGLPVMDGYEVAEQLRQRCGQAILIALTGYGREQDRARARAAGFQQLLVKPIGVDELLAVVARG
jgi:signal transduction histidine kinase